MRPFRPVLGFVLSFVILLAPTFAQQTTTAVQPGVLLQSLSALAPSGIPTDITLTGTARRIGGADDESGTAILKTVSNGSARIDFSFPSGQLSEISDLSGDPKGIWTRADGISHAIAAHNLLGEPAWFFPTFAIARRLSNANYVASDVGRENHSGQTVEHIVISQISSLQSPPGIATLSHLTQVDFFLDSGTLLPQAITFNVHPDNDAGTDIPIEIRFSDYRSLNGVQVPYHVQKYLNNGLVLDFQAQTVAFNSGLAPSTFAVQ